MYHHKIGRTAGVILLLLVGLLLAGCGESTSTPAVAANTPGATATSNAANTPTVASAATAPAQAAGGTGEVIVFAASSLTDSFNAIKTAFEAANPGTKVTLNYGGSSTLRTQMEQGAKADVFASADQKNMDAALKSNVVADAGKVFANNKLVAITPKANKAGINSLQDLAKPGVKFVTATKDVPVGQYTLDALDKMTKDASFGADYKTKVMQNFVSQETNVKQIVTKIQTGEADAAIVYQTDVTPKVVPDVMLIEIPNQFNVIATYPIALDKTPVNADLAKKFIAFMLSDAGQAIMQKAGFIPVA